MLRIRHTKWQCIEFSKKQNEPEKGRTYWITGVDIGTAIQIIQYFIQVPISCSSKEAGVSVSLQKYKSKRLYSVLIPLKRAYFQKHVIPKSSNKERIPPLTKLFQKWLFHWPGRNFELDLTRRDKAVWTEKIKCFIAPTGGAGEV